MMETSLATSNYNKIKTYIRSNEILRRFAEILGDYQASAYISSVLIAVANNPQLMTCTPQSIVTAAMRAATLRLSCDPATGQAHLVPFKNKATLIIGYKGLRDMAVRTGKYRYIHIAKIYEGDKVVEDRITGVHRLEGQRVSDTIIGYLFYFELYTGFSKSVYMTVDEIHEHARKYSKSYDKPDSPWKTDTRAMEKKTILRLGLLHWGYLDPNDVAIMNAVDEADNENEEDVVNADFEESPPAPHSEEEILHNLGFGPQENVESSSEPKIDGRPLSPPALKSAIEAKAKRYSGQTITQGKRGLVVNVLEKCFADGAADMKRHQVCKYLTDTASIREMPDNYVAALFDWLHPVNDSGGDPQPDPDAAREAEMVLLEAVKGTGQPELL